MAVPGDILSFARAFGDASSLSKGARGAVGRIRSRTLGRGAGRGTTGMSVFGLIAWAAFFDFLTTEVRRAAAKQMVVLTAAAYAEGYELGWSPQVATPSTNLSAPNVKQRPFWRIGVRAAILEREGVGRAAPFPPRINRSGLYFSGRFTADLRGIVRGDILKRLARRSSGAATTRFFWGALTNPDVNVFERLAERSRAFIRKAIRAQDLVDTGALLASVQIAPTEDEALKKSVAAMLQRLETQGRVDELQDRVATGITNLTQV